MEDPGLRLNMPTPEGREAAAEFDRLYAPHFAEFDRLHPNEPPMCNECAYRPGTLPNGCAPTVLDAMLCAVHREPFYCHKGIAPGAEAEKLCQGWVRATWEKPEPLPGKETT